MLWRRWWATQGLWGALSEAMLPPGQLNTELRCLAAVTPRAFSAAFYSHEMPPPPSPATLAVWCASLAPFYRELAQTPPPC